MNYMKPAIVILGVSMAVGCASSQKEPDGPAEQAGESVDEAAEDTKEAAEDAGEKVEEKAEDAKEEINEETK
jgi:hypothetical protein